MNALVRKEIRLLTPAWIVAMLLAIFPEWIGHISPMEDPFSEYAFFAVLFGILLLAIVPFGQEWSFGTLGSLLSQPVPRQRIWEIKTKATAAAIFLVAVAFCISCELRLLRELYRELGNHPFTEYLVLALKWLVRHQYIFKEGGVLIPLILAGFAGALWATLVFRQTTAAFWCAVLVPAIISGLTEYFFRSHVFTLAVVVVYSVVCFLWARKIFLRAQDLQWSGGEIAFPSLGKKSAGTLVSVTGGSRHWLGALVRKEFLLHQANIIIAAVLFVLHLTTFLVRKFHGTFSDQEIRFVLETFWGLWLLMPLLFGAAAIAEERKLAILESQLCLPVSRRAQLLIKFLVALVLSVALGAGIPSLMEGKTVFGWEILWGTAALFCLSFYASTLARTTLQAIGIAIALYVALPFCAGLALKWMQDNMGNRGMVKLMGLFCIPILLIVLSRLGLENFKWLHENRMLWRRNVISIFVSLAFSFALADGTYYRAWEFLTPLEPPPGSPRLSESTPVKFAINTRTISAILPDGRFWMSQPVFTLRIQNNDTNMVVTSHKAQFLGNSNWTEAASDNFQTLAIQSDGSLWNVQRRYRTNNDFTLTQIGRGTDWAHVAAHSLGFLLLNKSGALWIWGTNNFESRRTLAAKLELDSNSTPVRVRDESDWVEVFSVNSAMAKKSDGSVWTLSTDKGFNFHPVQTTNTDESPLGIRIEAKADGKLWLLSETALMNGHTTIERISLGENVIWKDAALVRNNLAVVALRNDRTLWEFSTLSRLASGIGAISMRKLSAHSDWVSITSLSLGWDGALALAADGSLWIWEAPNESEWLTSSRKPKQIGNVFEAK
jgi:alpha-tubulin suppressor-like RCC1 family protein